MFSKYRFGYESIFLPMFPDYNTNLSECITNENCIEKYKDMKILVPIKRVVDYNVKVRPLSDNSNVDLNNVKMAVNPFML